MSRLTNTDSISPGIEQQAAQRAAEKAKAGKWDLNIALFLFAIIIIVILLATYTNMGMEVVAPIASVGLGIVWFIGRKREIKLYKRFYEQELSSLAPKLKQTIKDSVKETTKESIEEQVQQALRERLS